MAKMSERRQFLLTRIAALIKNLERTDEDFTLDKKLERVVERLEGVHAHHRSVLGYRKAQAERLNKKLEALAASQADEAEALAEDVPEEGAS